MGSEIQITYRHLDPSTALNTCIEGEFERLSRYYRRPVECRATVERTRRVAGPQLRVHLEVALRGKTLIADRTPSVDDAETDPYFEVREAFRAVRRQLTEYLQQHPPRTGPRVVEKAPDGDDQ